MFQELQGMFKLFAWVRLGRVSASFLCDGFFSLFRGFLASIVWFFISFTSMFGRATHFGVCVVSSVGALFGDDVFQPENLEPTLTLPCFTLERKDVKVDVGLISGDDRVPRVSEVRRTERDSHLHNGPTQAPV